MSRADRAWLAAMMAALLAWQVPLFDRIRAGQDEDFYGVPGMEVLRGGLPRIPYVPARDPGSIFYQADAILYTLPPLGFYLAAAAHLILGDGLGPARLASTIAGLVAVVLVWDLAGRWSGSRRTALLAAAGYLFGRAFLFPATTARPDMATVAFGLGAIWWVARDGRRRRDAALGGVSAGLALLCHPLGLVPASQAGLALLVGPGPWRRRLGQAGLFGLMALATFGLWLPLIAIDPEAFRIQFGGNVLGRAGPGLGRTILGLPGVLAYQGRQFVDHVGPIQAGLSAAGMLWAGLAVARGEDRMRRVLGHAAAASLLLVLFMGTHHIRNYYAYPAALLAIPVGLMLDRAARRLGGRVGEGPATAAVAAALLLALVSGSGLRVLAAHLGHWGDPDYRIGAFTDRILEDVPPGALVAADGSFVIELYLRGVPVVEALVDPFFFDVRPEPFDYALFGPIGLEQVRPAIDDLEFVGAYGDRSDPFGHYAELYRRRRAEPRRRQKAETGRQRADVSGRRAETARQNAECRNREAGASEQRGGGVVD